MMAAISCLALVVQGCGSGGADTSSGHAGVDPFPNKGGPVTQKDVEVASQFVGGTPGKATGSPITIGLITTEGGAIEEGTSNAAVYAAQGLVNEKLGGVDGHPIEFLKCATGGSEEKSQACGQKFANDAAVKAVFNPAQPEGGLALLGAINGAKVEICAFPTQPEFFGINVFCPNGGVLAYSSSASYISEFTSAKSVAQLLPEGEIFRQVGAVNAKQMEAEGLKVTEGFVPLNSPDVISSVVSSGAQNAEAMVLSLVSTGQCIAVAEALESLGVDESTSIIATPACAEPSVAEALGDLPHWTFFDIGESANLSEPNPEVQTYLDAVQTYGHGQQTGVWATSKFGAVLWLARVLREASPDLTTANIVAKAKAFKGPMYLGDPKIAFGQPPWRNLGSLRGRFFQYEGDGKWSDATDGKWIAPPTE